MTEPESTTPRAVLLGGLLLLAVGALAFPFVMQRTSAPDVAVAWPQATAPEATSAPSLRAGGSEPANGELVRTEPGAPEDFAVVPKQAEPVRAMLQAIVRRDLTALPPLYTPAIRERIQRLGWSSYVEQVAAAMAAEAFSLDASSYGYRYVGTEKRGIVKFHRQDRGKVPNGMHVVRDGERWLIDEW